MWWRSACFWAVPDSTDQSVILRTYSDCGWRHDWFESCVRSSWDLNGIQEKQGGGGPAGDYLFLGPGGGSKKDLLRCFSNSWWRNNHWNWFNWVINSRVPSKGWSSLQGKKNLITSHYCPLNLCKYVYYIILTCYNRSTVVEEYKRLSEENVHVCMCEHNCHNSLSHGVWH